MSCGAGGGGGGSGVVDTAQQVPFAFGEWQAASRRMTSASSDAGALLGTNPLAPAAMTSPMGYGGVLAHLLRFGPN